VTGSKGMHIVYDQLFVKEPGTKNETPWHTDHSYWYACHTQLLLVGRCSCFAHVLHRSPPTGTWLAGR